MAGFYGRMIPEIKSFSQEGNDGVFQGVLSTYGNVDLVGDICERGCFDSTIAAKGLRNYPLRREHDPTRGIGTFDIIDSTDALRIEGHICLSTQDGHDTFELMKFRGGAALNGLSIGYYAKSFHYDENGIRHLDDVELLEGSIVGEPANPEARIQAKSRRLAKMSRYARCKFLKELTEEQRNAALAELDALDEEDGKELPEEEPKPDEEKPDDPDTGDDVGKACKPDGKADETNDEKPENGAEDDDELVKEIRALNENAAEILKRMEA